MSCYLSLGWALPENILETELFGYARGAFTDAKADKKGLFQEADRGTILLDEIGELPLNIQAKLLRILQEKEVKPLGHTRTFKVDVRVVASTNRDLRQRMAEGKFREDLFYRINVATIELPPLRERMGDVPLLAAHFLKKCAEELGRPEPKLGTGALESLCRNPWPGNVRELENTIKRAVIMARGEFIPSLDLGSDPCETFLGADEVSHLPYRRAKEAVVTSFNRAYLAQALQRHDGNITRAARECGLERQALQQLLRRYGIQPDRFRPPR